MRKQRGFTLIELLIAITLFGIIAASLYNLMFSQTRFFETEEALSATQQNARIALKRISSDLMLAGRGVNALNLDNPDVILPNDGTGSINTVQTGAVTILGVPDSSGRVAFAATAPRSAKSIKLVNDAAGVARSIKVGDVVMIYTKDSNDLVHVAGVTVGGGTVTVTLDPTDALRRAYPGKQSWAYTVTTLSYRVNALDPNRPFLERRVNALPWEKAVAGIERLTFTYYNSAGTVISPNSMTLRRQIRKVRTLVDARSVQSTANRGTRTRTSMSTDVAPRNLMD